jgi:Arc/MetJ-type ribon-helix-helix transcriptional regulator
MSTISVPLNNDMIAQLDSLVSRDVGSSRADVMRRALALLSQEEAIRAVLDAMQEPTLKGDLRDLARKLK